jgi:hypothetical protein
MNAICLSMLNNFKRINPEIENIMCKIILDKKYPNGAVPKICVSRKYETT